MKIKKNILLATLLLFFIPILTFGQKNTIEVLYFKANLACCKARACNELQADVESVIKKYFVDKNIDFKVVRLADEANKSLIEKYNAKSQTVILVEKKNKTEKSTDLSAIVQNYSRDRNKQKFEEEMQKIIAEVLNEKNSR